jgi:DNA-binding MarR family transcriptional regulator
MVRLTDVFTELVRAEIELWNELDAHLSATVGILLSQYQALTAITNKAGLARVQDISDEMLITVGATSKLVDRLEREGLAERSAHPLDRRSSIVRLSEHGERLLADAEEAIEIQLQTMLGATLAAGRADALLGELRSLRASSRLQVTK